MSIACVIPARYQSTRFPGKLLAQAKGKTILQRTFEQALQCKTFDAIYVATDDERIKDHIASLGGEVIWTSPSCPNGTARIGEALAKDLRLQKAHLIVNLQGDHPCVEPATVDALVHALQEDSSAEMATPVAPLTEKDLYLSPHVVKCVFDAKGYALYFSRSPIPYTPPGRPIKAYAHVGVYAYRTPFLKKLLKTAPSPLQEQEDLEQLMVLENGHRIKIAIVNEVPLGIDTPEDLKKLEILLCP